MFKANVEGAWIDPDAASPEALVAIAARCPSGAITITRLDGGTAEEVGGRNVASVQENGPYALRGELRLDGAPGTRMTLCRCGGSQNKPFCDGTHRTQGFVATGEFPAAADLPAWGAPGALEITAVADGPLKLAGPHEVTGLSGQTVRRSDSAFLCRCGSSGNKPFCDGTHRRVGFRSV